MPNFTERRRRVLIALTQHLTEHGTMPTAAQLAAAGLRSEDRVREALGELVVQGRIRLDDTQPGGIRIVEGGSA